MGLSKKTERIELLIDIFNATQQLARAKPLLTPEELIAAILQEFRSDQDQIYLGSQADHYCLLRAGDRQPLVDGCPLSAQALTNGDRLLLAERIPALPQGTVAPSVPIYLRNQALATVYRLHWLPALIGRPSNNLADNDRLCVNLGSHAQWSRVSRRHVRVSEAHGQLLIEGLVDENPVLLRDQQGQETLLAPQRPQPLHDRDTIVLTNSSIELLVLIPANAA